MSYNAKKLVKQGLLTLPVVALLSGCIGVESEDNTTSASGNGGAGTEMVRITGGAVKGVIQQGIVTARRLVPDDQGRYQLGRTVTKPVRTNAEGEFDLQMKGEAEGWALVELKADANTRMICDVVPHCEINGATVPFGDIFALSSDFMLRGAVDLSKGSVYLTPLSQLAIGVAEHSESGLSGEALTAAYQNVEAWFGLPAGTLRLSPPDLTKLDRAAGSDSDAIQLAVVNAAFLAVVDGSNRWGSISEVLADMMGQIAAKGRLDAVGTGNNLSLGDLTATAAIQAAELQRTVKSSLMSQKLAIVKQRNRKQFENIANGYLDYLEEGGELADADNGVGTGGNAGGNGGNAGGSGSGAIGKDGSPDRGSVVGGGGNGSGGDWVAPDAALLTWTAPFTRESGDQIAMSELAGYEIAYGLSPEKLDETLPIADAYVDEVVIEDLAEGTWYFSIRSIDTDGNMSRWSEVVSKTVNI